MTVFVDHRAWWAFLNHDERDHARVRRCLADLIAQGVRLVTTDLVLSEVLHRLEKHDRSPDRRAQEAALERLERAKRDGTLEVVYLDEALWQAAWQLWVGNDRGRPWIDLVSWAVIRRRGIRQVVTTEPWFQRQGVSILPVVLD